VGVQFDSCAGGDASSSSEASDAPGGDGAEQRRVKPDPLDHPPTLQRASRSQRCRWRCLGTRTPSAFEGARTRRHPASSAPEAGDRPVARVTRAPSLGRAWASSQVDRASPQHQIRGRGQLHWRRFCQRVSWWRPHRLDAGNRECKIGGPPGPARWRAGCQPPLVAVGAVHARVKGSSGGMALSTPPQRGPRSAFDACRGGDGLPLRNPTPARLPGHTSGRSAAVRPIRVGAGHCRAARRAEAGSAPCWHGNVVGQSPPCDRFRSGHPRLHGGGDVRSDNRRRQHDHDQLAAQRAAARPGGKTHACQRPAAA